jgi:hypothetical protein
MEDKLKKSLDKLAERTAERARPGLAEEIKQRIPHRLVRHRGGLDTINIIIDLRVNRLTAAAVIIIAMILLAHFFSRRDTPGDSIFRDSKMLVKYILGARVGGSDLLAVRSRYENLVERGEEAVYYGDKADLKDSNAVLVHWKLSDGQYKVISGDLQEKTVSADELIRLQAEMLKKKMK